MRRATPALAILDEPATDNAPLAYREELAADGCMSVKEAEGFLGISDSAIYELIDARILPSVRLGRRVVIPRRAIIAHVAKNMTAAEPGPEVK